MNDLRIAGDRDYGALDNRKHCSETLPEEELIKRFSKFLSNKQQQQTTVDNCCRLLRETNLYFKLCSHQPELQKRANCANLLVLIFPSQC